MQDAAQVLRTQVLLNALPTEPLERLDTKLWCRLLSLLREGWLEIDSGLHLYSPITHVFVPGAEAHMLDIWNWIWVGPAVVRAVWAWFS